MSSIVYLLSFISASSSFLPLLRAMIRRLLRQGGQGLVSYASKAIDRVKRVYIPVLVTLDLGDDAVGRVDGQLDGGTVGLVARDTVDVDNPLLAVDLNDTTLTALVGATDNENLIVTANRERTDLKRHDQ